MQLLLVGGSDIDIDKTTTPCKKNSTINAFVNATKEPVSLFKCFIFIWKNYKSIEVICYYLFKFLIYIDYFINLTPM